MDEEDRRLLMYRIADSPYRKAGEHVGRVIGILVDDHQFKVRLELESGAKEWTDWEETSLASEEDLIAHFL
jgi:hypothetical protein